jgi:hypothetical protein
MAPFFGGVVVFNLSGRLGHSTWGFPGKTYKPNRGAVELWSRVSVVVLQKSKLGRGSMPPNNSQLRGCKGTNRDNFCPCALCFALNSRRSGQDISISGALLATTEVSALMTTSSVPRTSAIHVHGHGPVFLLPRLPCKVAISQE